MTFDNNYDRVATNPISILVSDVIYPTLDFTFFETWSEDTYHICECCAQIIPPKCSYDLRDNVLCWLPSGPQCIDCCIAGVPYGK